MVKMTYGAENLYICAEGETAGLMASKRRSHGYFCQSYKASFL